MTTAELLVLLEQDPAAGILAVADLREQRAKAKAIPDGEYFIASEDDFEAYHVLSRAFPAPRDVARDLPSLDLAEHIAAEANPAHALAAVRRWRGVVERHRPWHNARNLCQRDSDPYPCPDLTETLDEARAYLGGAT